MSPKINHTSAGNFFLKRRLPKPFNRFKKSISRKDTGTMGYTHVKKKSQFLPCSICKKHKMNLRSKYNS